MDAKAIAITARCNAKASLKGSAKSVGAGEARGCRNAVNGLVRQSEAPPRFVEPKIQHKGGGCRGKDLFEYATKLSWTQTGPFS